VHQAPREHEAGARARRILRLELKLLAMWGWWVSECGQVHIDLGISAGRPKIADYPFTTLEPNLGVVAVGDIKDEV